MNLARCSGYATAKNAKRKLEKSVPDIRDVHYLIAVNDEGRFVPVVVGATPWDIALIHKGITVVG